MQIKASDVISVLALLISASALWRTMDPSVYLYASGRFSFGSLGGAQEGESRSEPIRLSLDLSMYNNGNVPVFTQAVYAAVIPTDATSQCLSSMYISPSPGELVEFDEKGEIGDYTFSKPQFIVPNEENALSTTADINPDLLERLGDYQICVRILFQDAMFRLYALDLGPVHQDMLPITFPGRAYRWAGIEEMPIGSPESLTDTIAE